jgi:hypothetical protein
MNRQARSLQTIGFALLAVSVVCGFTGYDSFRAATSLAEAASQAVEGMDFVASVPRETYLMGGLAVVAGVASLRCLVQSRALRRSESSGLKP